MFTFIKNLFTKKETVMLSNDEIKKYGSDIEKIKNRLTTESNKTSDKNLKRAYDSMNRELDSPLASLNDIKEIQEEIQNDSSKHVDKFDSFSNNK